ncbi:MAG: LacI family DNA-binding transcriptional regulator [Nonomuraea sp.]|nr:LacI family DNA-binding transcriptional regulator [Nonomuraea sp.]NUP79358.1 LacI family DNA-binding transcriptional regulator [Nonomuraea sp.]NUR49608.1 LacI family DNA-binding transcriptional regulator [Hamadaea sp.]NUT06803.1 LacI family DNA-binding transcriptional regulator [Hamadaea sp.]
MIRPVSQPPHPKSRGAARRAQRTGPTMEDVARIAGVSRGTVSRVLNGGHDVSDAAEAAVREAMRTTGYVVNHHARSLVTRRTNAIAFVLSEPHERLFEDPNFNTLARAAAQQAAARGASLVLMVAGDHEERNRISAYVRSGHVDGVLLVSTHRGDPLVTELAHSALPVVVCGKPLDHTADFRFVAADDRAGGRLLTRHLLDLGRRRIGMITGPQDTSGGAERLLGYQDVLGDRFDPGLVVPATEYSLAAGEAAMRSLVARASDVDAVFAASDLLAAGALAALRDAGRRVPADVALGGFDDSVIARSTVPALTTVRQPIEEVGRELVRVLFDLLDGRTPDSVTVPVSLVRRASA